MEHLLQDIKGVGRDRRTNARIPKSEWDLGKVSKALKRFATDDYAEMSAAQRKEKFVNIAPGGSPFMTVNSSFTLKMLNGEQDESYTGSMPQHTAWEHHYQKDLMCLKPEEEAVALYLNLLPRADNGAAQIICVDFDDDDRSLVPDIWFDEVPYLLSRKGFHFYMNITDMPPGSLNSQFGQLNFSGEIFGGVTKANVYESVVGWCEDEAGQRTQTEEEPLKNWDVDKFALG